MDKSISLEVIYFYLAMTNTRFHQQKHSNGALDVTGLL